MLFDVPNEPLWTIFTPQVINTLRRVQNPSDFLVFRLRVLAAGGLNSSTWPGQALRAYKSAWEVYLFAAFACGLFADPHGADLRARLTGSDDENFRSAMSECLAAWYLAGRLKLRIEPRPEGRPGRPLEFVIKFPDGDINVEVKAPHRPVTGDPGWGDDSDSLQSVLHTANKQFEGGTRNLLVIVPGLLFSVFGWRTPIERAFIGETIIQIPIDIRTGGPAGPTTFPYKQSGDFLRTWRTSSQGTAQWTPRHTRIGAALFLNDYDDGPEVKHRALMVHNPNAAVPLPRDPWSGIPERGGRPPPWLTELLKRKSPKLAAVSLDSYVDGLKEMAEIVGVDNQLSAGDVFRLVGCEEQSRVRDIPCIAHPPHRTLLVTLADHLFGLPP
jgi:hypothetical protein